MLCFMFVFLTMSSVSGGLWLEAPEAEEHVVLGGRMMNFAGMVRELSGSMHVSGLSQDTGLTEEKALEL